MLKYYHIYATIYRDDIKMVKKYCGNIITDTPYNNIDIITWDNLTEKYYSNGIHYNFNYYNTRKGRIINFWDWSPFKKITRDIKEWKEPLNIKVVYESIECKPSMDVLMNWHDSNIVLQYIKERIE